MCGIAGFLTRSGGHTSAADAELAAMASTLCHRGPDDGGTWSDAQRGIGLGHRRLSIIDLSPEGRQPMKSATGRYTLIFNGEVYNYRELRSELAAAGSAFRGHSDTEVMLAAIEEWGLTKAVQRFNGMFAFALWDAREDRLVLGRDRMGEKPLYYGWCNSVFLFGSELKSLRAHPAFEPKIDRDVVFKYTRLGYVPGEQAIYEGIKRLPPATLLEVSRDSSPDSLRPVAYWSLEAAARAGAADPLRLSETDASASLEELVSDAVRLRMVADVPLGAFLSGGIDSSTVVSLMQAHSSAPIKTFTIGFREDGFDEARHAAAVARHLGTEHTELYVSADDAMRVVPLLPSIYDEPFADDSQIPTYLVSRLARTAVTVALSGDGGDELFGGYTRHTQGPALWRRSRAMPRFARAAAARMLRAPSGETWSAIERKVGTMVRKYSGSVALRDRAQKLARVLELSAADSLYDALAGRWTGSSIVPALAQETSLQRRLKASGLNALADQLMFLDLATYLPDDILVKVDRASMAVSLESRIPLLDHRVIEFALRVPLSMKIRSGVGKQILRRILYAHVPQDLVDRPKAGFALPIAEWLRGGLKDWAEHLLDETRLHEDGFFSAAEVRGAWSDHLSGRANRQDDLWTILMFQAWLDATVTSDNRPRTSTAICR